MHRSPRLAPDERETQTALYPKEQNLSFKNSIKSDHKKLQDEAASPANEFYQTRKKK